MDINAFLKNIILLKDEYLIDEVRKNSYIQTVSKKEKIYCEGTPSQNISLAVEGIFRAYTINDQGHEITDCIVSRPGSSLMTDFDITAPPSATQEALTPGKVFRLPLNCFFDYLQNYPEIAQYYNKEFLYNGQYHVEKSRIISSCSAEARYLWFLNTHPGVVNRIPDKYIASFLQISTVTLSQVRKRLREKGTVPVIKPFK